MNPIFGKNPEKALAVARALGALPGPETAPEERARAFAALLNGQAKVVVAWPGLFSSAYVGFRAGAVFLCAPFSAYTPDLPERQAATLGQYRLDVGADCAILTAYRGNTRRARRRAKMAWAVYRAVTGVDPVEVPAYHVQGSEVLVLTAPKAPAYFPIALFPYIALSITHHPVFRALADRLGGMREVVLRLRHAAEDRGAIEAAVERGAWEEEDDHV